jgi:hypothetical protein
MTIAANTAPRTQTGLKTRSRPSVALTVAADAAHHAPDRPSITDGH